MLFISTIIFCTNIIFLVNYNCLYVFHFPSCTIFLKRWHTIQRGLVVNGSLNSICSVIWSITYINSEICDFMCLVSVPLISCVNGRLVISNKQRSRDAESLSSSERKCTASYIPFHCSLQCWVIKTTVLACSLFVPCKRPLTIVCNYPHVFLSHRFSS